MSIGKLLVCITIFVVTDWSVAANLYRYTDDNGTLVLESTIPPEFVSKGYEILNEQGRVIKMVPPALSPEELAKKKAEQERQVMQSARDAELLKLYRSPEDVDRARASWMSRLDVEINLKQNQKAIKQSDLDDLRAQAAALERINKPVPEDLLAQMKDVQQKMDAIDGEIAEIEARKAKDEHLFDLDKQRVAELLQERKSQ